MKTTYRRMTEFSNDAAKYLQDKPEENKFSYALKRVIKRIQSLFISYHELLEDARIADCAVDDKGIIIRDERDNYKFTREALLSLNKAKRALDSTEVEIEPFKAAAPDDLSDYYKESFAGFVL